MRVKVTNWSLSLFVFLLIVAWLSLRQESSVLNQVQQAIVTHVDGGQQFARIASNTLKASDLSSRPPIGQEEASIRNNEKARKVKETNITKIVSHSKPATQEPSLKETRPVGGASQTKDSKELQSPLTQAEEEAIEAKRKAAYEKFNPPMPKPLLDDSVPFSNFSHIRYGAHSGIGHRLVRQAAAVYIGRLMGLAVRGTWSNNEYSNNTKDIFAEMFEPFTRKDFPFVNSTNRTIKFGNEVDHMASPSQFTCNRQKQKSQCSQPNTRGVEGPDCGCTFDEIQVHTDFYKSLRDRYVRRQKLSDFMERHKYSEHTVFGLHIRAGNGEQKDFTYKKRGIHHDAEAYVAGLIKVMRETIPMENLEKPPMIFLATDDPNYRAIIVNETQKLGLSWPVVVLEQDFAEEGVILHGGRANYEKWFSMFEDMVLLSHSDVLIAVKYSSFTQALPMYLVFDRPESERKLRDNYCEVIDDDPLAKKNGTGPELSLYCYHSYMQNCCGTDNTVHRKVTKFLEPKWRGKDLEVQLNDFGPRQYLSFEDSLGRF